MPESKPKGSYHVDREFVDASHPDQSGFIKLVLLQLPIAALMPEPRKPVSAHPA